MSICADVAAFFFNVLPLATTVVDIVVLGLAAPAASAPPDEWPLVSVTALLLQPTKHAAKDKTARKRVSADIFNKQGSDADSRGWSGGNGCTEAEVTANTHTCCGGSHQMQSLHVSIKIRSYPIRNSHTAATPGHTLALRCTFTWDRRGEQTPLARPHASWPWWLACCRGGRSRINGPREEQSLICLIPDTITRSL